MPTFTMLYAPVISLAMATGILAHPLLSPRQTSCASGVHIIAARGSLEPPGEGILQTVSNMITSAIPGSDDAAIDYPATLTNYGSSESDGVAAMTSQITSYVSQCPDTKLVLLGYSQGGQVLGDVLGGGSFNNSEPLDFGTYSQNIAAAVQFGDPAHVVPKPYDQGTSTKSGVFPRANTTALDQWSGVLASFCASGDTFCDSGNDLATHLDEVPTFAQQATSFVTGLAKR